MLDEIRGVGGCDVVNKGEGGQEQDGGSCFGGLVVEVWDGHVRGREHEALFRSAIVSIACVNCN